MRRAFPFPVPKDIVYTHLVATFGVTRGTATSDVGTLIALRWLAWDPKMPGHLCFGDQAPIKKRPRESKVSA